MTGLQAPDILKMKSKSACSLAVFGLLSNAACPTIQNLRYTVAFWSLIPLPPPPHHHHHQKAPKTSLRTRLFYGDNDQQIVDEDTEYSERIRVASDHAGLGADAAGRASARRAGVHLPGERPGGGERRGQDPPPGVR